MPRVAVVVFSIVVALALTACGGSDSGPSNPVAAAAASTEEAGTARVLSTVRGNFAGSTYTHRRSGVVDFERDFVSITQHSTIAGVVREPLRQVELDGYLYTELGKRWVREKEGNGQTTGAGDPTRFLRYLQEWSSNVVIAHRRPVAGVAKVYRAKLDLRSAVEHELKQHGWTDTAIEQFIGESLTGPATVEVALDRNGLIRRVIVKSRGSTNRETETLLLSDFGLRVDAKPPV